MLERAIDSAAGKSQRTAVSNRQQANRNRRAGNNLVRSAQNRPVHHFQREVSAVAYFDQLIRFDARQQRQRGGLAVCVCKRLFQCVERGVIIAGRVGFALDSHLKYGDIHAGGRPGLDGDAAVFAQVLDACLSYGLAIAVKIGAAFSQQPADVVVRGKGRHGVSAGGREAAAGERQSGIRPNAEAAGGAADRAAALEAAAAYGRLAAGQEGAAGLAASGRGAHGGAACDRELARGLADAVGPAAGGACLDACSAADDGLSPAA